MTFYLWSQAELTTLASIELSKTQWSQFSCIDTKICPRCGVNLITGVLCNLRRVIGDVWECPLCTTQYLDVSRGMLEFRSKD